MTHSAFWFLFFERNREDRKIQHKDGIEFKIGSLMKFTIVSERFFHIAICSSTVYNIWLKIAVAVYILLVIFVICIVLQYDESTHIYVSILVVYGKYNTLNWHRSFVLKWKYIDSLLLHIVLYWSWAKFVYFFRFFLLLFWLGIVQEKN